MAGYRSPPKQPCLPYLSSLASFSLSIQLSNCSDPASCEAMTPRQPFVILREDVISLLMPEEKAGNTGVIGAISPMLTSNWRRPSPNHGARDQTQNFTNDDSMLPTELHTQPLPTKFS
eukprot:XP_006496563.1 PREDICTED: uncharacterized protein LOC381272 isoform X1 [Mus musculus]